MGWSVRVKGNGLPDPQESIASMSNCSGNVYTSVKDLCGFALKEVSRTTAEACLERVICEIDRGNDGFFSDKYAVECDQKWSEGKETKELYAQWEPLSGRCNWFKDYESFCGWHMRKHLREDCVRFYLYYRAGYEVEFEW